MSGVGTMGAMEASLRRAVEAGDVADPAFRQSIYDASQRALERMILSRELDEPSADAQRNRLVETIMRVEGEYFAYYNGAEADGLEDGAAAPDHLRPAADEEIGEPLPGRSDPNDDDGLAESEGGGSGRTAAAPQPLPDDLPDDDAEWTPGGRQEVQPARKRLPVAALVAGGLALVAAVLAILLLVFGWPGGGAARSSTSEAAPPADLVWINAFSGSDLETVSTPNGGRVEAVEEANGRKAVRVATATGSDGEIVMGFGPGLVGELAGSKVRIELTAGSPDETPRAFSVRCVFGGDSVCERQHFSTSMREEAFVFDVAVPQDVKTPAGLAIGPGDSLDIYSIRLRVIG